MEGKCRHKLKACPSHLQLILAHRNRRLPAKFRDSGEVLLGPAASTVIGALIADLELRLWATQFAESRQKELSDLLEKGVFEFIKVDDVPGGVRVFTSRFVDSIKNEGTPEAFAKSCLVVCAFKDKEKWELLTQSPTIQRASLRIILSIAAARPELSLYLRDIS